MSVDSGEPRQRTVAELLAANGGGQPGRRRRRRAEEDDAAVPPSGRAAPEAPPGPAPRRPAGADSVRPPASAGGPVTRGADGHTPTEHPSFPQSRRAEPDAPFVPNGNAPWGHTPNGHPPNGHPPNGHPPNGHPPNGHGPNGQAPYGPRNGQRPPAPPNGAPQHDDVPQRSGGRYGAPPTPGGYASNGAVRDEREAGFAPFGPGPQSYADGPGRPVAPPYRDGPERPDDVPTGRFGARGAPPPAEDGGPPTMLGAPPLDDDRYDTAAGRATARVPADGGPPTGAYDPFTDDGQYDDGYDGHDDAAYEDDRFDDGPGARTGLLAPERGAPHPDAPDEYEDHGELENGAVEEEPPKRRRGGRTADGEDGPPPAGLEDAPAGAAGTGQAWAVVIAQWIGGAVAGAAIWVGFRYLWFAFPIVALALAVVLTVGLVLGVRALLRNDDLKTTLFAVLVGLLLTVSPAILVLLER